MEKSLGGSRPLLSGTAAEIQQQFAGLAAMVAAASPALDITVKTRDVNADGVMVRIFTPEVAAGGKKLPVGVYYHGGGYLLGNLDSEDGWCRFIAKVRS